MAALRVLAGFMLLTVAVAVVKQESEVSANPIRKVVSMLQSMQKKITAEGEKEKELFDKFNCYCQNGDQALAKSISEAETKAPQVSSDIEEGENQVIQLKSDLKSHQTDRAAAKSAMAEATTIREKEAAEFASLKAELDANLAALAKATAAIEKAWLAVFCKRRMHRSSRNWSWHKTAWLNSTARSSHPSYLVPLTMLLRVGKSQES
jgi:chromosome segregation ATPase